MEDNSNNYKQFIPYSGLAFKKIGPQEFNDWARWVVEERGYNPNSTFDKAYSAVNSNIIEKMKAGQQIAKLFDRYNNFGLARAKHNILNGVSNLGKAAKYMLTPTPMDAALIGGVMMLQDNNNLAKKQQESINRIKYLKDFHTGPAYISYPDDADGRASRWAAELWRGTNGK